MSDSNASTPTAVLAELARAWNAGDSRAYAARFATTATYVTFDGRLLQGRDQIDQVHRFLFDGPLQGSRLVSADPDEATVTTWGRDVVVVVSQGAVLLPGVPDQGDRDSIQTMVLHRTQDRWLVAAFQNTRRSFS